MKFFRELWFGIPLSLIIWAVMFVGYANAACSAGNYYTTTGTNCIFVSPTNPLPTTSTFTPSGTQDVNLTKILGAAPSLTNPLWVFPATGATFPISGTVSATQSGTWTVQPGNTANTTAWLVTGTGGTFPVTGTFWQATQPVSGTFWQATQPVSGTFWQATQPISAASLPLPALAATSTKQSDGTQKTQIVDGSGNVIGATSNALNVNISSGFGTTIAVTQSTSPWVVSNGGTFAVQATLSAETTKVIGTVNQGTSPWVVSGTVTANAGTNLNTSLLALESGGNLATLAGGVTASVYQHNTKQINGVVPLMGNGVTGTGSQRVTIASDNTAFSVNATLSAETTKVIGTVNQGTSPWVVAGGGTAGSAASGVVTVQGIASMTALATTLPTTPAIASGSGVVPAPSSAAAAGMANVVSTAAESNHVLKASAGNLYSLTATIGATSGYLMLFNATSLPGNGAVTPVGCYRVLSDGTAGGISLRWDYPLVFSTGITAGFSTTGCFTLTASATGNFFGQIQ